MKRLFEKYRDELSGLVWLFVAIFVSVSLISYNPADPSLNSLVQARPHNLCGYLGSFIADLLLQAFGLPAWILAAGAARQAYVFLANRHGVRSSKGAEKTKWYLDLMLLTVVVGLLSLHLGNLRFFGGQIRIGGWLGFVFTRGMVKALNEVGLAIVLWSAFAGVIVLYTDRTWGELTSGSRKHLFGFLTAWGAGLHDGFFAFISFLKMTPRTVAAGVGGGGAVSAARGAPASASSAPSAASNAQTFYKIEPQSGGRPPVKQMSGEVDDVDEGAIIEADEDDPDFKAPITGFLKEQLIGKVTRPKKPVPIKIQRRVENWELPKLSLLDDPPSSRVRLDEREIKNKAKLLVEKLAQFSVRGEVVGIKPGPAVTMFEFKPAPDVKISKITDLADDLSLALSSESVRIIAPIPGRDVVGIETSNSQRESVFVKDIIQQEEFWDEEMKLPVALGRKADGEPRIVDLRKMPHLLVAGTTGSGKSVFIVSMITGLLFRHSPKTLKLILVDPKQVDLAAFNDIPHLIMPPIREAKKAVSALRWAIREMEKRYRSMSKFGARGLETFNETVGAFNAEKVKDHETLNGALEGSFHPESYYYQQLPYIMIVVEEFGDLMVVDKINVEQAVVRLAQMARACGIHLVLAMQSPRRDVVTGLIKTNIPGRISFKVASKMDSRIILDEGGAERLLARGDMLFLAPGVAKPERHHGPYLSENEIARVMAQWKVQGEPEYDAIAMKALDGSGGGFDVEGGGGGDGEGGEFGDDDIKDERYDEVLAWTAGQKEVSASLLQRKFRLGYPRAARMIEIFESEGVVGPSNGSKPRQVLVRDHGRNAE